MSKKFIDLANLKSNLENFLSEIISPTFATKEGVSNQLGNHTVKSDVPENAVFTDTVYDDTDVQKRISDNGYGEVAGGKNLLGHNIIDSKIKNCSVLFKNDTFYVTNKGIFSSFVLSVPTIVGKSYTVTIKDWSDYSYRCIASVSDLSDNTLVSMIITDATLSMTFTAVGTESLIYISPNNTTNEMSNTITFKCMLEEGSVATEYEPYFPSNKMLEEEISKQNESLSVIGKCKNLLNPTLQTTTINGVTCTDNGDGTYTLNGTASAECNFLIPFTSNGKFKIIGCPKGGNIQSYYMDVDNFSISLGKDFGEGCCIDYVGNIRLNMCIAKDATVDLVFKPMITTNLNATYDDFVPYTGGGDTLNSDVANIKNDLNNYALKSLYGDTTINVGRLANSTVGNYSTAEGAETTASGDYSHTEGKSTTASAAYAHSEGVNTSAVGQGSHAEGSNLELSGSSVIFEDPRRVRIEDMETAESTIITVVGSQAFGLNSHAEGCSTLAYGKNSHTEGYHTFAQSNESHAEGCESTASGKFAHAEGYFTRAIGESSHAEGGDTTARGSYSHAEGRNAQATSYHSHAEGYQTTASGNSSHAEGYYTKATNYASHASGKYNAAMTTGGASGNTTGTAFVIGNGTGNSALSNAFSVQYSGIVKAKSTITASTTADYAEFFEWLDKNPNEEDRVGHFVTLDGNKIKIATSEDDYILGIVSGEPFVLGNGDCDTWNGMYLHDEFRRTMYEPAPKMIEILDNEGNPTGEYKEVEGEYEGTRPILNPDYDPTQEYISRFDRVEWSPIGMLGVLAVLHDGTAEVNGYVTVNNEGIATKCTRDTRNSYRVIKKVSDKVVEVIFR